MPINSPFLDFLLMFISKTKVHWGNIEHTPLSYYERLYKYINFVGAILDKVNWLDILAILAFLAIILYLPTIIGVPVLFLKQFLFFKKLESQSGGEVISSSPVKDFDLSPVEHIQKIIWQPLIYMVLFSISLLTAYNHPINLVNITLNLKKITRLKFNRFFQTISKIFLVNLSVLMHWKDSVRVYKIKN